MVDVERKSDGSEGGESRPWRCPKVMKLPASSVTSPHHSVIRISFSSFDRLSIPVVDLRPRASAIRMAIPRHAYPASG